MTVLADQATRLTARIAPYRDAIKSAREAGLTWRDLARILGVKDQRHLRWAVGHCERYKAEQVPLPLATPEPVPTPEQKPNSTAPAAPTDAAQQPSSTIKRISL